MVAGNAAAAQEAETSETKVAAASTSEAEVLAPVRAGSDFMLDVIKGSGFEYVAVNPGSSYPRPDGIDDQLRRKPKSRSC